MRFRDLAAVSLLAVACPAQVPTITTLAGTTYSFREDLPGPQTPLGRVTSLAIDPEGSVVFTDDENNVVGKIRQDGTVAVIAGNGLRATRLVGNGGKATDAPLAVVGGAAYDPQGNLHFIQCQNSAIRRVAPDGLLSTIDPGLASCAVRWWTVTSNGSTLAAPVMVSTVTFDEAGAMYYVDGTGNKVFRRRGSSPVEVVAGSDTATELGDGGPATAAKLAGVTAIIVRRGELYIAELDTHRVRRVAANGVITTVAGTGTAGFSGDGGPGAAAQLNVPVALAIDAAGNLYVSDRGNNRVRRLAPGGVITTVAGNGQRGFSGDGAKATDATIDLPGALTVDARGALYVADTFNRRIRRVDTAGAITTIGGNGLPQISTDGLPARHAFLSNPVDVGIDASGRMFIVDTENHRIRMIDRDGLITSVVGTGVPGFSGDGGPPAAAQINRPLAVGFDRTNNMYILDGNNGRIRQVVNGQIRTIVSGLPVAFAPTIPLPFALLPYGMFVEPTGAILIGDAQGNKVVRVTAAAQTVLAGSTAGFSGDGGPAKDAKLSMPAAITMDARGNIYVGDQQNKRIRRIAPDGNISTVAELSAIPTGVAISPDGTLYAGGNTGVIWRIGAAGPEEIVTPKDCIDADGGPAKNACLSTPMKILFDAAGNLLIVERAGNRLRVLLTEAQAPTFSVTPETIGVSAVPGGAPLVDRLLELKSSLPGVPFTARASAPWIKLSVDRGVMPATIRVSLDPGAAQGGGEIVIESPNARSTNSKVSVQVAMPSTTTPRAPRLEINPKTLTFSLSGTEPVTQTVTLQNTGGGSLPVQTFGFTVDPRIDVKVEQDGAAATPSKPVQLSVRVTPAAIPPGTYRAGFGVIATEGLVTTAFQVPVVITVKERGAKLLLSQTGFTFQALADSKAPQSQVLSVLNDGDASANWTIEASTLSGGSWLRAVQAAGVSAAKGSASSEITLNPSGLAPGAYFGQIRVISREAGNSPQMASVLLQVLPANSPLAPDVRPSGLVFSSRADAPDPGSQSIVATNRAASAISFTASPAMDPAGGSFQVLPASGTIAPGQSQRIVVHGDMSRAIAGARRGSIALSFSDGSSRTIELLSVISGDRQTTSDKDFERSSHACNVSAWHLQVTNPAEGQLIAAGSSVALEAKLTDSCGHDVASGNVSVGIVGAGSVPLKHAGQGIYKSSWTTRADARDAVKLSFSALGASGVSLMGDQRDRIVQMTAPVSVPRIGEGGVLNAASFERGGLAAPGSIVSIYGDNLLDGAAGSVGRLPLPIEHSGTAVQLGDRSLPLFYVSTGQLNAQIPFDVPVDTQMQLTVKKGPALSFPETITVAAVQPAIFTVNQQGTGQGSIVNANNTLANAQNPAARNAVITIYCTGLGAVTPAVPTGQAATTASRTVAPVTVTIDGKTAAVTYAGVSPGSVGLFQVNVRVPADATPGPQVPVVISARGMSSPPATIAVR